MSEECPRVQRSTELGKLKWEEFWGTMRGLEHDVFLDPGCFVELERTWPKVTLFFIVCF